MSNIGGTDCPRQLDRMSSIIKNMESIDPEDLFEKELQARCKKLRLEKNWTAEQMAEALGVSADRYRKYENRSPLPYYYIPKFALVVDRSIEYVLTGKERKQGKTKTNNK